MKDIIDLLFFKERLDPLEELVIRLKLTGLSETEALVLLSQFIDTNKIDA